MEHEEVLCNRDKVVAEIDAPLVTRALLGAYPRLEILVLLSPVECIERDALLDLPALEAVVVDAASEARPEDCDYGIEGDRYRHVHVLRVDTTHPPSASLPDAVFLAGYPVPVLLHSEEAGMVIDVSDGRVLRSTREGYEVRTLRFPQGDFTIGDADMRAVEWDGGRCNVPYDAEEGGVELRVPYGVCEVGEKQYKNNTAITSVRIPATVNVVGENAFNGCTNLGDVKLMSGVREIGECAFRRTGITTLTLPGSVATIGAGAFSISEIQTLALSEGLEEIGDSAFSSTKIEAVAIPSTVRFIGAFAFNNVKTLTELTFEGDSKLQTLWNSSFSNTGLTSLVLPRGLESIGSSAFSNTSSLASVTFERGSSLKSIGSYAFYSSGITTITIPASVTSIGSWAFDSCSRLEEVTFEADSRLTTIDTYAFSHTKIEEVTLPKSVTSIGINPFVGCLSLRAINVEAGSKFTGTGRALVDSNEIISYACGSGTTFTVPSDITALRGYSFCGCTTLTEVTFGADSQLTSIGDDAFYSTGLKGITIPKSVKSIGNHAFYGSKSLLTVAFKEGSVLKKIGNHAFGSTSLDTIMFPPSVTLFSYNVFQDTPITRIEAPGTASFDWNFLAGISSSCTVCFYSCTEMPGINYHNINPTCSPTPTCSWG